MHEPLILVHCRHTRSCSPGPPSMWEVSCGPSELCCLKTTQPDRSLTGTTPTQAARAAKPPTVTRTLKSKYIKSIDDLTREFPDRFTGIGTFPGEYKVRLCPDAHPVILMHLENVQLHYSPKGKEHLAKMEAPGSHHPCRPTHRLGIVIPYVPTYKRQTMSWALPMSRSVLPQQSNPPWSPQDAYCRRSCTHEFANLHYFSKLDAHHAYWSIVIDEESSLLTTFNSPFGRHHFLHLPFDLVCLQDIFQKKMDQFLAKSALVVSELPMTSPYTVALRQNMMPICRTSCRWPAQVWSCVQSTENTCKGPSCKLCWLPIWCQWCTPGSGEGWCCACSPNTHKCHWAPRVPRHGDISQPLHPWPVHSDCPSARTPEKRCQLYLECQLWGCFWGSQASHHQQHHPQILWPVTAWDHTSRCLTGGSRHSTPTEQQICSFHKQSTHQCTMEICKHWERDASSCLQSRADSTLTSMDGSSWSNQTISHLNLYPGRT